MFHKINKPMFFILLIPFYLLILISFIGISAGSVEWLTFVLYALLMIMAAWGLSRKNSRVINIIGLLLFTGMGISLIYPALTQTVRVGPWTLNIYLGLTLMFWGIVAFVYDIVKPKTKQES